MFELVTGALPRSLEVAVWVIWGLFVLDFLLEITIAPSKVRYLRSNWLTVVSLALPALRVDPGGWWRAAPDEVIC